MVRFNQNYNKEEVVVSSEDASGCFQAIFFLFLIIGTGALLTNIVVTITHYEKLHGIYKYTAIFYNWVLIQPFVGFGVAYDWLTAHSPLPWANLTLVLTLVLLLAPPIGLVVFLKRKQILKYVLGILCMPALIMVIYYLGSTIISWLFAK